MLPILSEHSWARRASFFILYASQGIPVGLIYTAIPAWIATSGGTPSDIARVLGAASLPWTLKLIYGVAMDRWQHASFGLRRPWLQASLIALIAVFVGFIAANPGPQQVFELMVFAFLVNLVAGFQDVAIDGMAIDVTPESERSTINGYMFAGASFGAASSSVLMGRLVTDEEVTLALAVCGGMIALVLVFASCLREHRFNPTKLSSRGQLRQTSHKSMWKLFLQLSYSVGRIGSIFLVVALLCAGFIGGLFNGVFPLISVENLGWSREQYTDLAGAARLIAGGLALVMFGYLGDRLGPSRSAAYSFLAYILVVFMTAALTLSGANHGVFITLVIVMFSVELWLRIGLSAFSMNMTEKPNETSQFAIYMAIASIGMTLGASSVGYIYSQESLNLVWFTIATLSVSGAIGLFYARPRTTKAVTH